MSATVAPRMNEGNQITVYKCPPREFTARGGQVARYGTLSEFFGLGVLILDVRYLNGPEGAYIFVNRKPPNVRIEQRGAVKGLELSMDAAHVVGR